uniref:Uncharacterized protein n=1 Tax=Arundo donax TaxID=35708 RepID=A0A0A9AAW6_ARUDO
MKPRQTMSLSCTNSSGTHGANLSNSSSMFLSWGLSTVAPSAAFTA